MTSFTRLYKAFSLTGTVLDWQFRGQFKVTGIHGHDSFLILRSAKLERKKKALMGARTSHTIEPRGSGSRPRHQFAMLPGNKHFGREFPGIANSSYACDTGEALCHGQLEVRRLLYVSLHSLYAGINKKNWPVQLSCQAMPCFSFYSRS